MEWNIGDKALCVGTFKSEVPGEIMPILLETYIVRHVINFGYEKDLRFEEIVNPKLKYCDGYGECCFTSKSFVKLLSEAELLELVEENKNKVTV